MNIRSITNSSMDDILQPLDQQKKHTDFGAFLKQSIEQLNQYELQSQKMDTLMSIDEIDNLHEVMIAAQKSEIALQFAVEVKNKVLDAYKEIMRLQL